MAGFSHTNACNSFLGCIFPRNVRINVVYQSSHILTYIPACIHTYGRTDLRAQILTYIPAYIHTYIHTDAQIHELTYVYIYLHTCIHLYRSTDSRAHILIYIQTHRFTSPGRLNT